MLSCFLFPLRAFSVCLILKCYNCFPKLSFQNFEEDYFCSIACCFRNEGWGAKNHLISFLFTGGVQGEPGRLKHQWLVWKQFFFPLKKQCFVIHCSKSKRLSWFCFIFTSSNRIMGLLRKNWVISWLFPEIKMPWGVMISRWRDKEENGLVP